MDINRTFPLPHTEEIKCLHESKGLMVFIEGEVPEHTTDGFSFNFMAGPTCDGSARIHFHMTTRNGEVIRNTHEPGSGWMTEENEGEMPFHPGQKFNLLIKLKQAMIKVFVNGSVFCQYEHKLPMDEIDHFHMYGDYHITNIYQAMTGKVHPSIPLRKDIAHCMHRPHLDFWIRGTPRDDCKRFNINLKNQDEVWVFHCDARVDVDEYQNIMLANTCDKGGHWHDEIRPGDFPFAPGRRFDLYLAADQEGGYEVYVNGVHIMNYPNRIPLPTVDNLTIEGDVEIEHYFIQ
ncbi:32 kDa beta-galactoside-binding lectin-like [Tubulanus polymorphus]|uniref:32 kDa beta-galactoside-binding lectin-like n=1 Tax=Tubulanus polymorphus TaxID=672921 RepID=UPI003DA3DA39